MTGILNMMLGIGGIFYTNTFNFTSAIMGGGDGYSDGSAGTSTGIATGSITGGTLTGGKLIAEVSTFATGSQDRLRVRGFSSDPGQGWLKSITVNGVTHTLASGLTYNWDSTHNIATWQWNTAVVSTWNITGSNTYNGNTIIHQ